MKFNIKILAAACLLLTFINTNAQRLDTANIISYIKQYKDIAINEMNRSGIPASITLAQGIHESSYGTSYLSKNTNNHFGIKCKENWTGKTFKYTDDAPNECFRVYDSVVQSYRDHTDFLKYRPRYASLFLLDKYDYKGWAHGLKKAGYATNPKYAPILIKTIEDFQLDAFDKGENPSYLQSNTNTKPPVIIEIPKIITKDTAVIKNTPVIPEEKKTEVVKTQTVKTLSENAIKKRTIKINKAEAIKINKNESLQMFANALHISEENLLIYNDVKKSTDLKTGDYLFIQKKKKKNKEKTYTVKNDDNIWKIAQKKGIQLSALLKKNKLQAGEEPAPKSILSLKKNAKEKPSLLIEKSSVKKEITQIAKDTIVRANDTVYPALNETIKSASAVDSSKLLNWEADTKLLENKNAATYPSKETKPSVFELETNEINEPAKTSTNTSVLSDKNQNEIKSATNDASYTVVKGDTLYNISKRFNVTIAQIMEWNNLSEQSIKLGQVLKVK
jgi:LysM repeat protein